MMRILRATAVMRVSSMAAVHFALPYGVFFFFNVFFSARARQLLHRARYSADTRAGAPSLVQFEALLTTTPRGSRLAAAQDVWRCLRRQTSKGTRCCCKHDLKQILFFFLGCGGCLKMKGAWLVGHTERSSGLPGCLPLLVVSPGIFRAGFSPKGTVFGQVLCHTAQPGASLQADAAHESKNLGVLSCWKQENVWKCDASAP